jgi:flagellin-like protein
MKKRGRDDDAVSPVIGVILMVAITVILAAVIGTYVVGLGGDVGETPRAGVTIDYSSGDDSATVRVVNPGNVDALVIRVENGIADDDLGSNDDWQIDPDDSDAVKTDGDVGANDQFVIDTEGNEDVETAASDVTDVELTIIGEVDDEEAVLDGYEIGDR